MKRITLSFLAASALLLAASCGNDSEENMSTSDTMSAPMMENTAPAPSTTSMDSMATDSMMNGPANTNDNTGGGISTGNGAEPGGGGGTQRRNRSAAGGGQSGNGGPAGASSNSSTTPPGGGSTYERAQPGDPVDGRSPVGTSR